MATETLDEGSQRAMVRALREGLRGCDGPAPLWLETHISHVLVAPPFAYKFRKPVRLPFLDFTSLALRERDCREELRLNRRLAPALYRDVVTVCGTPDAPRLADAGSSTAAGPVLDYAVRMQSFEQSDLWEQRVPEGRVGAEEAEQLARTLAAFHVDGAAVEIDCPHATPQAIRALVRANLEGLDDDAGAARQAALAALRDEEARRFERLAPVFAQRNRDGFVRECHGDLHLGNVVTLAGVATPFDCIEFNASMRWMDVMSEVAFMAMDLEHAGRPDLAFRFLNAYLDVTGDHAGLAVFDYYRSYRATVRAKVAALRAAQSAPTQAGPLRDASARYLALAASFGRTPRPVLAITHGLSGSGKSALSTVLAGEIGAIRLRSDLERKRQRGLAPLARGGAQTALYTQAARDETYARLAALATDVLSAGMPVIVDATFLQRAQRAAFAALAERCAVPFVVIDLQAPADLLRERVAARRARDDDASDADAAVLQRQLDTHEPLRPDEPGRVFVHDARQPLSAQALRRAWREQVAAA
jgi:aminoglycoside phosphotransferase family enzyme/predicted kinase